MKADLKDITFLILIRLDSVQRLENILAITEQLCSHFDTNIIVLEVDKYCNGFLKKLLNANVHYQFIKDKDTILHKTRYFNFLSEKVQTPYMAIWDADIVADKNVIIDSLQYLRNGYVVYPYNGQCFDTSEILRDLFLTNQDIDLLYRHKNKMKLLYNKPLVGGAVFVDVQKFKDAGGENERHYGWGNDDYDRYYRFLAKGYPIYRTNNPLFHLSHPRGNNSQYHNALAQEISSAERAKKENLRREDTTSV